MAKKSSSNNANKTVLNTKKAGKAKKKFGPKDQKTKPYKGQGK
jgi:hypothetical protein